MVTPPLSLLYVYTVCMVTRCHTGPCPLPSPGDELLRSSSHRTLGRGYGAPCRATDSARLQAARAARALETLGYTAQHTPGLDNVLELDCPGPPGLARHKQRMRDFSQEEEGTGLRGDSSKGSWQTVTGDEVTCCHLY